MSDDDNVVSLGVRYRGPLDADNPPVMTVVRPDPGPCSFRHKGPYLVDEQLADVECGTCRAKLNPMHVLGALPATLLLRRVSDMMDEVNALRGQPRPAEKWLGMGRDGWQFWQFVAGVLNAWSAINAASETRWIGMTVSVVCVFATTLWRLPYKPPRYLNKIDKETS